MGETPTGVPDFAPGLNVRRLSSPASASVADFAVGLNARRLSSPAEKVRRALEQRRRRHARALDAALRAFEASPGAFDEPMAQLRALHAAHELGLLAPDAEADEEEEEEEEAAGANENAAITGKAVAAAGGSDTETVAFGGSPDRRRHTFL